MMVISNQVESAVSVSLIGRRLVSNSADSGPLSTSGVFMFRLRIVYCSDPVNCRIASPAMAMYAAQGKTTSCPMTWSNSQGTCSTQRTLLQEGSMSPDSRHRAPRSSWRGCRHCVHCLASRVSLHKLSSCSQG